VTDACECGNEPVSFSRRTLHHGVISIEEFRSSGATHDIL